MLIIARPARDVGKGIEDRRRGGVRSQALHDCFPFGGFGEAFSLFFALLSSCSSLLLRTSYQNRLARAVSKIEHGWSY